MAARRSARLVLCAWLMFMVGCGAPGWLGQVKGPADFARRPARVLVFTYTAGFRHDSIPAAADAIRSMGDTYAFEVVESADPADMTDTVLRGFRAVVFVSTTGDLLDASGQEALERFIRSGGGFAGIHAAADAEYGWPWYGQLIGAYFESHPPGVRLAELVVVAGDHPSSAGLPQLWVRDDEWYNFRSNPRGSARVLVTLDESTYSGGTMGADHPIAWCHGFDGGRSWYTGVGHSIEAFSDPVVVSHIAGGIRWAAGLVAGDCST